MRRRVLPFIATIIAVVQIVASCDKTVEQKLPPTPDPELGEDFAAMEPWIDMSKTNQFNESLFCNDWILSKVTYEIYVDGVLTETKDATDMWAVQEYSIFEDHTIRTKDRKGIWLYSHNILMWKTGGGYQSCEVVESKIDALHLRSEDYPLGIEIIPYFVDKSGKHGFFIFEYTDDITPKQR